MKGESGDVDQHVRDPDPESALIARFGFISSVGLLFGKLAQFSLNILLSRTLGPSVYGLYAIGRSVIGILKPFAHVGLDSGVVRFGAMQFGEGKHGELLDTVYATFLFSVGSSALAGAALYLVAPLLNDAVFRIPELTIVLRLFAFLLPIYVLTSVVAAAFQAVKQIQYQQFLTKFLRPLLDIVIVGVAFLVGFQLEGVIVGLVISGFTTLTLGMYLLHSRSPIRFRRQLPDIEQIDQLIRYSLPVTLVAAAYIIALRTDRIMLGALDTSASVGIYNAAAIMAIQIGLVHTALVSIFTPVISDLYGRGEHDRMVRNYNLVKRWALFGASLGFLPLLFYPRVLLSIFGPEFSVGWPLLLVLPIGPILGSAAGPTGTLLKMAGNERLEFWNATFLITGNIVLNLLFIPILGVVGAALATVLSQVGMNAIQVKQIRNNYSFMPVTGKLGGFILLLGLIGALGVAANLYLSLLPRTFTFLVAVVILAVAGYIGHTPEDRQAIAEIVPNEVLNAFP